MANELSTRLTNDASQFNQSMEQATDKVEQFQGATDDAKKSIDDLGKKGALSTRELLKEIGKLSGSEKNLSNYRRQLAQMTRDIQDLSINYANMTKEMQNSDIGKATLQRINELTAQAGQYKDAIMDAQQSIKNMASDTQWVDAFKSTIDIASGALQTFAAAGILSAKSQEDLVKVIAKVKAVESSAIGVKKILDNLNKNSRLLDAVRTVQKAALVKATNLETAATGKATIAQKAFNLVAKANPYVLLATAALAAGAAIYAVVKHTNNAKDATKSATQVQKEYTKSLNEARKAAGDSIGKFSLLCAQYKTLKTEAEKTQWIKDNKSNFDELGLSLNNINDAQKILIDRADDYIRVLTLEAEAAALMSYYQDEYKKNIEKSIQAQEKAENAGNDFWGLTKKDIKKYGLQKDVDYTEEWSQPNPYNPEEIPQRTFKLTEEGKAKLKQAGVDAGKAVMKGVEESLSPVAKLLLDKQQEAAKLRADLGQNGGSTNNNNNNNNNGGKKGDEDKILSQIKLLEEAIETKKKEVNLYKDESEEQAKVINELVEMNKQYDALVKKHNDWLVQLREQRTGKLEPLDITVNPKFESTINGANAIKMPDQKLEVPITPKLEPLYLDEWLDGLVDQIDGFAGLADGIVGSFEGVYNSVKKLGDAIDDAEGPLESFFAIWDTGMQIINMAATIIDAVSTLTTFLNGKMGIQIGLKKADTETTKENTREKIKNAGADAAAAIAGGAKSVSDIPVVGWILAGVAAVTLLATLISAMSSAKGFATGGVVGGNSYYGDKILARLNSGELVLTRDQQMKAWDEMNQPQQPTYSSPGGKVEFVIHGTELRGVLRNIDKKNGMI